MIGNGLILSISKRSNEVKITERAVKLELSLQHRPDAILNLGGLLLSRSWNVTFYNVHSIFLICPSIKVFLRKFTVHLK